MIQHRVTPSTWRLTSSLTSSMGFDVCKTPSPDPETGMPSLLDIHPTRALGSTFPAT
jgi:hypothetical protein